MSRRGDGLIAAVRDRGNIATDVRAAAHEAAHALTEHLQVPWTFANIDRAVTAGCTVRGRVDAGKAIAHEVRARAVELTVCTWFDEPYDLDSWSGVCFLELAKHSLLLPSIDHLTRAIRRDAHRSPCRRLAERVARLAQGAP